MLFYDIYLKDRLTGNYVPVPILVQEFSDTMGQSPNTGSDPNYFRFTRRFFLYDNLGGIGTVNGYINGDTANVIIWILSFYGSLY